jgi:hypothetical protein
MVEHVWVVGMAAALLIGGTPVVIPSMVAMAPPAAAGGLIRPRILLVTSGSRTGTIFQPGSGGIVVPAWCPVA